MSLSNLQIITKLKNASDGLLWLSESDYPFETVLWSSMENLTNDKLLQKFKRSPDTLVEVRDIDRFFARATTESDWHDQSEKVEVEKYRQLVEILKTNLTDIKVYRVGEIEIDVYIIGKTPDGSIAGLSTMVVET
ncbi:MAG: nuclease A inhibitor family protein [Calothrix sp. MO_167.B12]|nr:nuclease A inhibitor family protein [Calothrix sp. MO_167.B12]